MDDRVDEALRDLERQRRRLQPNQGRVSRRNARRSFLGAMKALRNALNASYPRIERAPDPESYVVDIFEKAHREGRRFLNERWRVARRRDFGGVPDFMPFLRVRTTNHGSLPGPLAPMGLREAMRAALWCRKNRTDASFRLRRCGEKEGLVTDIL